jgi:Tol biopolymer transport system component
MSKRCATTWPESARVGVGLAVAACCAIVLAVAAAGCGGDSSGAATDLLFVSSRDGDYAVYGMTADGGDQHRLTEERGDASTPAGLQYQVDPAWSPDGQRIAFASAREGSFDIYVMNADGSGSKRLTSTSDDDRQPSWSPDGKRIVFARSADGSHIWVINADGSGAKRVTDDLAPELEPAWSPDGSTIAYARRTPGTEIREIWLADADGGNRRTLTKQGAESADPAWSPDGSLVAFSANPGGSSFGIFTTGVDGQGLHHVVVGPDDAVEPAFSPDGQSIAYYADGAITVRDAEGNEVELTNPADNSSSPAWKPTPPS